MKRVLDVTGAALGLLLLLPLLLTVALAIRVTSPGPAIFRQRRAGRGHREFVMWKFRTMVDGADQMRAALTAKLRDDEWLDLERDPRVTPLGRLLRRTSASRRGRRRASRCGPASPGRGRSRAGSASASSTCCGWTATTCATALCGAT